jgi:TetR/AcrR family transcriptional regulator, fatty acid metabolism regulator protein
VKSTTVRPLSGGIPGDYAGARMSEQTVDRRRELLDAAVRVFARKGFRGARVGDIAEEAGVAHGLLYHYFRSKDEVLETIFRETWQLLQSDLERIEGAGVPLREQLRRFARIYLGSWLMTPELIGVLVREIARSPDVGERVDEIQGVFVALERIIRAAQERGEVRADCHPAFAAWAVYGALEEILTGWVLGQVPAEEEDVERAVATVVEVAAAGLAA